MVIGLLGSSCHAPPGKRNTSPQQAADRARRLEGTGPDARHRRVGAGRPLGGSPHPKDGCAKTGAPTLSSEGPTCPPNRELLATASRREGKGAHDRRQDHRPGTGTSRAAGPSPKSSASRQTVVGGQGTGARDNIRRMPSRTTRARSSSDPLTIGIIGAVLYRVGGHRAIAAVANLTISVERSPTAPAAPDTSAPATPRTRWPTAPADRPAVRPPSSRAAHRVRAALLSRYLE